MNSQELYKDIRKQSKIDFKRGMLAAHFLTRDIGRLCSVWFIKHGIVPNQITVLMIVFGIVGSILFAIPNVWCKIAGYLSWLMWFAMDCSDGQVARYTKTFSKYGTEMDYMAHLIDHPLMNIALWMTFIEMNVWNPIIVSALFIISISLELIVRNLTAFEYYISRSLGESKKTSTRTTPILKYFWRQITLYPSMIICFSWIIILDYYLQIGFSLILYTIWFLLYLLAILNGYYRLLCFFYKNQK